MKTPSNQNEINIGVDTGKHQLDIHIRPLNEYFPVENNPAGIKQAIKAIKPYRPKRVIIEATGRLGQAFVLACFKAQLPIVIANPILVKKFAGAIGRKAKTDKLDAALIAHYGEAIKPALSTLKPEDIRLMGDLVVRRQQLLERQTMEKNRLQILPKPLVPSIKAVLNVPKKEIAKIDQRLPGQIEQCHDYKQVSDIAQSVPGVGPVVAITMLSYLPGLGCLTRKQAAALVGVAPMNRESGRYQGKRMIRGGRSRVRTVLYMAMMSAIQCNPVFKAMYQRLPVKGKAKKTALIACVRKLVVILNAMVGDKVFWQTQ